MKITILAVGKLKEKYWKQDRIIDKNLDEVLVSNPNLVSQISGETSDSDTDTDDE